MRILIADDEKLARASLISMLDELNWGIEITGEVSNGEDFLESLQKLQPDAAIVDISMPKLNGLEAIERGRLLSPHTKWVILSGYSEFEYARKAVQLGASMYLLKPLGLEELESTMKLLFLEREQTYSRLDDEFEHHILTGLNNGSLKDRNKFTRNAPDAHYKWILLAMDTAIPFSSKERLNQQLLDSIRKPIRGLSSLTTRTAVFPLATGETAVALYWPKDSLQQDQSMKSIPDIVHRYALSLAGPEAAFTAMDCEGYGSMDDMLSDLTEIRRLLPLRTILGMNRRFAPEAVQKQPPAMVQLGQLLIRAADYYRRRLYMEYCAEVEELSVRLRNVELTGEQTGHIRLFLRYAMDEVPGLELEDVPAILDQYADRLLTHKKQQENGPQDMVSEVISFMEQHYASNLSIAQLAEILKITPNYLSTMFHKSTGTTFTKYLARLRIHRSKELLSTTSLPVKEIALQVGYYSTRHFAKLFIESEGCYPTEYRKQIRL